MLFVCTADLQVTRGRKKLHLLVLIRNEPEGIYLRSLYRRYNINHVCFHQSKIKFFKVSLVVRFVPERQNVSVRQHELSLVLKKMIPVLYQLCAKSISSYKFIFFLTV